MLCVALLVAPLLVLFAAVAFALAAIPRPASLVGRLKRLAASRLALSIGLPVAQVIAALPWTDRSTTTLVMSTMAVLSVGAAGYFALLAVRGLEVVRDVAHAKALVETPGIEQATVAVARTAQTFDFGVGDAHWVRRDDSKASLAPAAYRGVTMTRDATAFTSVAVGEPKLAFWAKAAPWFDLGAALFCCCLIFLDLTVAIHPQVVEPSPSGIMF